MQSCSICGEKYIREEMTYLEIYVTGSEGTIVCFECRMLLTNYIRGLRQLVGKVMLKSRCTLPHTAGTYTGGGTII